MNKRSIGSDLTKADRIKDSEIDDSGIPPLDGSFFTKATETWPPAKRQITIRLDADVRAWLKANGMGYQTRINRILRAAMDNRQRSRSAPVGARKRSAASAGARKRR